MGLFKRRIRAASKRSPSRSLGEVEGNVDVSRAIRPAAGRPDPRRAEDRMEAIFPGYRVALPPSLAEAAEAVVGIPIVPAARFLAEIAAYRPPVPDLLRGDDPRGLRDQRIALAEDRALRDFREGGQRTYPDPRSLLADVCEVGDALQVDEELRIAGMDPVLE
jgi:hypothetical protein